MKIRSLSDLEDILDEDLAWRKKEISILTLEASASKKRKKEVMMRTAMVLIYAHWEGHIKKAAHAYLAYLNHISPKYKDIKDNFFYLSLCEKFNGEVSFSGYRRQTHAFDYVKNGLNETFSISVKKAVSTGSNLKSEIFSDILIKLGLNEADFELKYNLIDEKLLKNRNAIAHGDESIHMDLEKDYLEVKENVVEMMELFNTIIKNSASNKSYLKENTHQ